MNKPTYTEKEIEELEDLHENWGYQCAIGDVQNFLKNIGYSDVNAVVIAIRKEFQKRLMERQEKYNEKWKGSTLIDKLYARMDWKEKQKQKP